MSSASEDASEPSSIGTSEIRLYALEPKGYGLGADNSMLISKHSQQPRWTASTLKIQSMAIRNEVTSRMLSGRSIPVAGANRKLRVGGIELEANALL
jgi:hypothetical protein